MARLIRVDGSEQVIHPKGKKWTLSELQRFVGGYIEFVSGTKTLRMIVDEDGIMKNRPVNARASDMVMADLPSGQILRHPIVILGDAVILDAKEKM